ncbi:hypothetical protein SBRCBS47491_009656 [Sporothrix bragantina]|uniref:RRM domain-containing protein n=1 Tax=Sporothrix bragantina TaxID=671064 RepID=A0ABP0CY62_9PEZI
MDYDIEMEDAAGQYQNEVPQDVAPQEDILAIDADGALEMGEVGEDGEIDEAAAAAADNTTVIPTKVHIRGLDALNPDDIKAYVSEHFTGDGGRKGPFDRIEWIDDTSANLIFITEAAAASALAALSSVQIDDMAQLQVGQMLPAKTYSAKPDEVSAGLSVRFAVASDKKEAGAATRSRFYLLHPEYDPEERKRNYQNNRRRDGRDGGYRDSRNSRHRSYRDDRDDRENDIRNNSFDVNLYDDDAPARAHRSYSRRSRSRSRQRRRSWSRSRSRDRSYSRERRSNNRDKELFPVNSSTQGKELFPEKLGVSSSSSGRDRDRGRGRGRDNGRLRDRSASPRRDDGDFYYDEAGDDDYDGRLADERAEAASAAAARNRDKARAIKDRLSTKDSNGSRELFPSDSRGTAQMDLFDSTSTVTSKLSGMSMFLMDGACNDGLDEHNENRYTANRITRPSDSFNIRGSAGGSNEQGISIKGAASARELFPDKLTGNGSSNGSRGRKGGKDATDNSLASRIQRPRQRAEDSFH